MKPARSSVAHRRPVWQPQALRRSRERNLHAIARLSARLCTGDFFPPLARDGAVVHSRLPICNRTGTPMNKPNTSPARDRAWRRATVSGVTMIALAWLVACASTQLKDTWKDPAFTGQPLK